ncbi:hypothetical protein O181_110266 [Austropuccinia psidii MF-1]|uniref:Uncharacterized protein n=1 Tax=Austropuccinia psidii MF-1 TaxID=1389203 RepID=A0A9Q3JYV0_9BASI|nr:hypothetical protein [Austropuccinia psidii MF-1]
MMKKSKNPAEPGRFPIWIGKTPIVLPCHKNDMDMNTALLILNRLVSWTGIFKNIISNRYPNFTSALWKNLDQLFGTKLTFSIEYHPQTDGLAGRMILTLEETCTLLPSLELAYKTSIYAIKNHTPAILEEKDGIQDYPVTL